jgi:hypothetical protein
VAGPNGLDLKKIQTRVKFKIYFKFGLKIKKIPKYRSYHIMGMVSLVLCGGNLVDSARGGA